MGPLQAAVAAGYGAREILNFLARNNAQFSHSINQAIAGGYTADQIVRFIENHQNTEKPRRYDPNVGRNPLIEAAESVKTPIPGPINTLGKMAVGAAGAYVLNRAIPAIANSALTRLGFGNGSPHPPQNPPQNPSSINSTISGPQDSTDQIAPTQNDSKRILDQMDVTSIVDAISHENPEIVSAVLEQKMLKPEQLKWLRKNRIDLRRVVSDYLTNKPPSTQPPTQTPENAAPQSSTPSPPPQPLSTQITRPKTTAPEWPTTDSPKKLSRPLAILPSGQMGTVVGEKNGISQIDVDGVIKHRKSDDLILSPETEKEIGDLYEQLLSKIPESERSSVIDWAGYDEKTGNFAYRPHDGHTYEYTNIPPDWIEKLKSSGFSAKTTGQNSYGAWESGGASRNAGVVQLIAELKKRATLESVDGQKPSSPHGKEYTGKFDTVYDFLSIPKNILRQREKERQKAAAAARKQEKEHEKLKKKKPK